MPKLRVWRWCIPKKTLSHLGFSQKNMGNFKMGLSRDWCIKFATGMNLIIGIVQKLFEWSSCSFAKMVVSWGDQFGKIRAWSLLEFLSYAYYHIYPSRKFDASVSMYVHSSKLPIVQKKIQVILFIVLPN